MKPSAVHAEGFFAIPGGLSVAAAMLDTCRQPREEPLVDLNRTPAQIADAAAEQLRALNHRTLDVKAFPQPGDASETVDALVRVVRYLPQALRQIEAAVRHLHDEERIRLADKPPAETSQRDIHERVSGVLFALEEARVRLSGVDDQMRAAAGPLSTMGVPWEDAEGDEDV